MTSQPVETPNTSHRAAGLWRGVTLATSQYVPVRDGTCLALDLYLPTDRGSDTRFPTIVQFTPYYRRFADAPGSPKSSIPSRTVEESGVLCTNGYALAVVDVRGCGASFGSRKAFRSPQEREDYVDVVDWLVAQPWCDGNIGSLGASYTGAAADFLASSGHPAVKAIIPGFAVWDTYADMFYPGGMLSRALTDEYGPMIRSLDVDDRDAIAKSPLFDDLPLTGPAPVDDDSDRVLLDAALAEHHANFDMGTHIREVWCRDGQSPMGSGITVESTSPMAYASGTQSDTAVYVVTGWFDGAAYCDGNVRRFNETPSERRHLRIGPWDHTACNLNVSPFDVDKGQTFDLYAEYMRFFDHYLKAANNGFGDEAPVHYYTMGRGWSDGATFPPLDTEVVDLHIAADGALRLTRDDQEGTTTYRVDPRVSTGRHTRHQLGIFPAVESYYDDWDGRSQRMCTFTSPVTTRTVDLTGYTELDLTIASSSCDGGLFAYLEDVDADDKALYVTEGVLRLGFVGSSTTPAPRTPSRRNYRAADFRQIEPGAPHRVRLTLLPISWRLQQGHRLRLAIAGADADNIHYLPVGELPDLTVFYGGGHPCELRLPLSESAWL